MTVNTKPDNRTRAQRLLAERQVAIREQLAAQKYHEAIQADLDREIGDHELAQVKFKTETRLKLLAKFLPDLRQDQVELTGADGGPLAVQIAQADASL